MARILFYVDTDGATGGPGVHSVRVWRAIAARRPDRVGPLVVPHDNDERRIFAEQLGADNVRTLGTAAVVDPAADPVVVLDDFFERLCALARREGCDHIHLLWGFLHPRQVARVTARERLPVTITLCDATDKREAADLYAMFFQSDRWERHLREVLTVPVGYQAISERTRLDALSMGVPQEAIQTVHLWVDPKLGELREELRGGGHEDYVAFVGGLAEYKGTGHLLDFALAYPDYPIRITGYTASDFPIEWARYPSIQYLGYLPYRDAMRLVARARALLYLSYSEGFGLPMIEAQALGVPLIVNPRNVMVRELLAKGSYVSAGDVGSPTSIKVAIDVATRDRASLVASGLANAARFDETTQVEKLLQHIDRTADRLRRDGWIG